MGEKLCSCGREMKLFIHNCNGSSNMPEIFGCPKHDDFCAFCLNDDEEMKNETKTLEKRSN